MCVCCTFFVHCSDGGPLVVAERYICIAEQCWSFCDGQMSHMRVALKFVTAVLEGEKLPSKVVRHHRACPVGPFLAEEEDADATLFHFRIPAAVRERDTPVSSLLVRPRRASGASRSTSHQPRAQVAVCCSAMCCYVSGRALVTEAAHALPHGRTAPHTRRRAGPPVLGTGCVGSPGACACAQLLGGLCSGLERVT